MGEQTTEVDDPRRVSGWLASGSVVGIAVVVAAGVVGWARLGADQATLGPPEPVPVEEGVPSELAGGLEPGDVPDDVAAVFDGPVVAARFLDEAPAGVDCDFLLHDFDEEPEVETVLATPDVVYVSMLGRSSALGEMPAGADRMMRATCSTRWERGRWSGGSGGGMGPAGEPMTGATGMSCCDANGLGTAEAMVLAPDGARWVVQERGGYHLAYPVPDSRAVPITWPFRDGQGGFGGGFDGGPMSSATTVTYVGDDGTVIGEATIRS